MEIIQIYIIFCCTACSVCYAEKFSLLLSIECFQIFLRPCKFTEELIKCSIAIQRKASCFFCLPVPSLSDHTSSSSVILPGHWASQPGLSSSVPDWVSFAGRLRFTCRRGLVHIQIALDHNRDYDLGTAYLLQPKHNRFNIA